MDSDGAILTRLTALEAELPMVLRLDGTGGGKRALQVGPRCEIRSNFLGNRSLLTLWPSCRLTGGMSPSE